VGAVGNDANDAGDDAVSPRHPHSQIVTVTSEGSLTSAKEDTRIKTRNTYLYLRLHRTDDSHTIYAVPSIFFLLFYICASIFFAISGQNKHFITSNTLLQLSPLGFARFTNNIMQYQVFFFYFTYLQVFYLQFLNRIRSTLLEVILSHSYLFLALHDSNTMYAVPSIFFLFYIFASIFFAISEQNKKHFITSNAL
jgi:hypothetical protein